MNKVIKDRVLLGVVLLFCVIGCILIFYFTEPMEKSDAIKFQEEYTKVPEDNVFVYRDIDEIIKILENGTGVVYLGFPECKWCQAYVPYLNEVAKEIGVEKIYYFNILKDRKENSEKYQKIVSLLGDNLLYDEEGNPRVYVPDITVVKDGKIVGHDNESSVVTEEDGTPEEYWTEAKVEALKLRLEDMMMQITEIACTSCNE